MGLFSSKKKIYVSSTVYNLAGDINDRVKFLTTVIMAHVLKNDANASMGEDIVGSVLRGPGIKFRAFGRWARTTGYSAAVGQQFGTIETSGDLDLNPIYGAIPVGANQSISIQTADIDVADYGYWADQWMLTNMPTEVDGDYEIDIDSITNQIYITFADGRMFSFFPENYDPYASYLYVSYTLQTGNVPGPIYEGGQIIVGSPAEIPSVGSSQLIGSSSTPRSATLYNRVTTAVTYSDGRPGSSDTQTSSSGANWNETSLTYQRDSYRGQDPTNPNQLYTDRLIQTNYTGRAVRSVSYSSSTNETIENGVVKTTTTTTVSDYTEAQYSYRQDSQKIVVSSWTPMKVLIYKQNSGNPSLDALFNTATSTSAYFPYIPIYINNRFVTGEIRDRNVKAVKKAMGAKYSNIEKALKDNKSLKDVDYAYIVFGVPLNTKEEAGRKYLFKFFEKMLTFSGSGSVQGQDKWKADWALADASKTRWIAWRDAQTNPASPVFGQPAPTLIPYPRAPKWAISLKGLGYNFFVIIGWGAIAKYTNTGVGKAGAKKGDCWITVGQTDDYDELVYSAGIVGSRPSPKGFLSITWQLEDDSYQTIGIWGLRQNNRIYKGKGIDIEGYEAMADKEESGFVVPLNEALYRELPLLQATQMSTSMAYMMLNSYKVVKQKWYATSWFKIVLIVIVIIVSILVPPAGAGAGAGLLGTAAAVGASLGFAGTLAIIVGTIANALAAMILSQIITYAATAVFGDKIGAIVGAIASVVAVSAGTSLATTGGLAGSYSSLMSASNLIKLTSSVGEGISGYLTAEATETAAATQDLIADYEKKSAQIQALTDQNLSKTGFSLDPLGFTDLARADQNYVAESPAMFMGRTLMTGSDIADTTFNMLTNFAAITTSTQLPT